MNHIYKTFYNQNKRTYVVGSETSKTHKKSQATCISALICGLILSTTSFAATNIKIFGTTTVSSGARNDSLFLLGNDKALQLDRKGINTITTTSNSVSFGKGNSQNGFF